MAYMNRKEARRSDIQDTGVVPDDQIARIVPFDRTDILRLGDMVEQFLNLRLAFIEVFADHRVGVIRNV